MKSTGCDGVAIGRTAVARPWVFAEWTDDLVAPQDVFLESAIKLAKLLEKHYEPPKAIRRIKRFALYFSASFKFGHTLYTRILNAPDMQAVENVLHKFFKTIPEVVQRPNMNFFI